MVEPLSSRVSSALKAFTCRDLRANDFVETFELVKNFCDWLGEGLTIQKRIKTSWFLYVLDINWSDIEVYSKFLFSAQAGESLFRLITSTFRR
jgi:hypothetical protein